MEHAGVRDDIHVEEQISQSAFVPRSHRRLTLADHPSAVGSAEDDEFRAGAFGTPTLGGSQQSTTLGAGGLLEENRGREQETEKATKSVLVLNGAACFIAGKLASTGEPRVSDRAILLSGFQYQTYPNERRLHAQPRGRSLEP